MTSTMSAATLEHRIGARGRFILRLPAGNVAVRGVAGDVARVRDLDGRSLADRFRIEAGDGSLSLRTPDNGLNFVIDLGFWKRGYNSRLDVELPTHAIVELETASADVRVDGLLGEGRYRTAAGELSFTGAGGLIDVEAVSGDVRIAAEADLALACRSVSGDLTVRAGRLTRLEIRTTSGDLDARATLAGHGPFSIATVSGNAQLATSTGLQVESKTVAGEVSAPEERRSESGHGKRSFSVGDGRIPLSFRSISGDLRISTAGGDDVATGAPATSARAPEVADRGDDDPTADARLELLRALERGELSVEEASSRLAEIDGEDAR